MLFAAPFATGDAVEIDYQMSRVITGFDIDRNKPMRLGFADPAGEAPVAPSEANGWLRIGLPFRRLKQHGDGCWLYTCDKLGIDGRCTIYEERPALCRHMPPGEAKPCVHYAFAFGMCSERGIGVDPASPAHRLASTAANFLGRAYFERVRAMMNDGMLAARLGDGDARKKHGDGHKKAAAE